MRLNTPRLRTVLLIVNMAVMLLPLGSVTFLRLYEAEMVRQKEASLFSQGAYVAALFRRELLDTLGVDRQRQDVTGAMGTRGIPVAPQWRHPANPRFNYTPEIPSLVLKSAWIREPHLPRFIRGKDPDPVAAAAGQALQALVLRAQTLNMDGLRIVDQYGNIVVSSFGEEGRLLIMWEEVARSLQGGYVSILRRKLPQKRTLSPLDYLGLGAPLQVDVTLPISDGESVFGAVVLSGTPSLLNEFIYGNKGQLTTALAMLMVAVTLISVFSSLTISEPIQAVIKQTELVARGDPAAERPIRFPMLEEVRQLSHAIARMAAVISERAGYITSFARSVSHEFKTPLTSITGATELLRDHHDEMSEGERHRFLDNLHADAVRLSNLVRRLLDFARAEVAAPTGQRTEVDVVVRALAERYRGNGLGVTVSGSPSRAAIDLSVELLESVISNLLDNVVLHCPSGATVELATSFVGGFLELCVTDTGPGISEANQTKVFQPFFTTARKRGGSGLGLSIVQAIIKAHHGSVRLESSESGTKVRIVLPAAAA